eukprot:12676118-Ditylum_brightwellii.AAC.1
MTKSRPYSGLSHVLTPEVLPCPALTVFPVVFRGTSLYVCIKPNEDLGLWTVSSPLIWRDVYFDHESGTLHVR